MTDFDPIYSMVSAKAIKGLIESNYALAGLASCRLLQRGLNDVYLVSSTSGERYVFRLSHHRVRGPADVKSETDFLIHVSKLGVPVATPIPTIGCELFLQVHAPEGRREGVLFQAVDGREPHAGDVGDAHANGRTLALLHNAAETYIPNAPLYKLDLEHLLYRPLARIRSSGVIEDPSVLDELDKIAERTGAAIKLSANLSWTYCHGDCHGFNSKITEAGEAVFFDFDDGGPGYLAYDLAVFLWAQVSFGRETTRAWTSFLDGYRLIRPITSDDFEAALRFVLGSHDLYPLVAQDKLIVLRQMFVPTHARSSCCPTDVSGNRRLPVVQILPPKRYPEMRDKIALVTGGSTGIGLATAQAFAREGATVIIAGRNEKRAKQALTTFSPDSRVSWVECDVTSGRDVERLMSSALKEHGQIDYAFNNAGSGGKMSQMASMSEDAWGKTINGYLTSVFLCMRYQLPPMLEAGRGVIVNNSSVDGLRGYPLPGGAAYSAAKHGVLGLTRSAALEHAKDGVRITAICPGWIGTSPVENFIRKNEQVGAQILGQEPIGRLGTPIEVANGVLWLCSDAASFMLGSPLVLDGGYMA